MFSSIPSKRLTSIFFCLAEGVVLLFKNVMVFLISVCSHVIGSLMIFDTFSESLALGRLVNSFFFSNESPCDLRV